MPFLTKIALILPQNEVKMMKKTVFIVFLGIVGLSAISAKSMPNPWIECGDDISCGALKAGFNFPLNVENYTVRAMEGMLEFRFPLDEKRNVIVRKSTTAEGEADENGIIDISGDYNQYPVNKTVTLENGVKFSVRGDEDNYKVANFAAESGYYSIMCGEGLNMQDIEHFYKLLEEAEAPRFSEEEPKTLEQLQDARRVDDIMEPVFTQDCFPKTLQKKGVTEECFEQANLGDDTFCSASQIKMIRDYYEKGQENDPLNDGSGNFCADE